MTVIVPSFRRPHRLAECLAGIASSERAPDEVLVVLRPEDRESKNAVSEFGGAIDVVLVDRPGVLAAMLAGIKRATGDVIAFLDDDAVPRPDWLPRIVRQLSAADVGGVGGRDIVTEPDDLRRSSRAGVVTRWGKVIGNHHVVIGPRREVDVLKGANMAFKREALALPVHLLGAGAQANFEVATCLWAQNQGWRLILDPAVEVMHLPGERFDADRRGRPSLMATHRAAYNLTVCLLSMRPELTVRRLMYGLAVGDRGTPGIVRAIVALLQRDPIWWRVLPSISGQLCGAVRIIVSGPIAMETPRAREGE